MLWSEDRSVCVHIPPFDAGEAKCTFGTGSFLLLNTGREVVRSTHGLITTVAHKFDGEPAAELVASFEEILEQVKESNP